MRAEVAQLTVAKIQSAAASVGVGVGVGVSVSVSVSVQQRLMYWLQFFSENCQSSKDVGSICCIQKR